MHAFIETPGISDNRSLELATASGIADVDSIKLSLARMSQDELAIRIAVMGILIAAAVNSVVKGGMAAVIGDRKVVLLVGVPLLMSAIVGLLPGWLFVCMVIGCSGPRQHLNRRFTRPCGFAHRQTVNALMTG